MANPKCQIVKIILLQPLITGALVICLSMHLTAPAYTEGTFNKENFIKGAGEEVVLKIGLLDCIAYALKNNSEIKIKRIEPKLKESDIKIAGAAFEPILKADHNLYDSKGLSPNSSLFSPDVSESRTAEFNVSLRGKLISGTEYKIDFLNKRYKSNAPYQVTNPYYRAEPKITITQPLFRDFGIPINRADIIIAQNNKQASVEGFKETVMNIVTKTKSTYYSYVYYLENYSIVRMSLERSQNLLKINKARYAGGLISSIDLLETETSVAGREKALISAESNIRKAEDEIKLITNLVDNPDAWNAKLELIDKIEFSPQEVDLVEAIESAFSNRADYQSQKINLKNRDIRIKTAKNALLPTIDLIGSFGLNGLEEDYAKAINKIDPNYRDWSAGVKFSLPWGGGDRALYKKKKLEKRQALIAFEKLEQNIILEVRDRVREIDTQYRQVQAAQLVKEKENQNYKAQKERYTAGQVSTHDILDYQDRLARAERDYIKALVDYNIAVINLDRVEGLTLVRNDIILEEL